MINAFWRITMAINLKIANSPIQIIRLATSSPLLTACQAACLPADRSGPIQVIKLS